MESIYTTIGKNNKWIYLFRQTGSKIMKVIFLDCDGVMNSEETCFYYITEGINSNGYGGFFMPPVEPTYENVLWGQDLVDNLKRIVDETDAKIVISSTWRMGHNVQSFIKMFKVYGWDNAPVIGLTPVRHTKRGFEIKEFLEKNPHVTKYVILDDDTDMLKEQIKYFVNTSPYKGLTSKDADKAIQILNGE